MLEYCYGVFETKNFDEYDFAYPDEEIPDPAYDTFMDMMLRYTQLAIAADKVYKELTTFCVMHANIMTVRPPRARQDR